MADRRAPGAPGRCGLNTSGTYGASAAADPGREAQPSGSVDDPGSTRWGRTPGVCVMSLVDRNRHHPRCDAGSPCPGITVAEMHLSCRAHPGNRPEDVSSSRPRSPWERGTHREHRRAESVSTCPKAPGSPHTSPTTGAIAEELGRTPQSSLGVAHPTRSIRTPTRCFHHLTPSAEGIPSGERPTVGCAIERSGAQ